MRDRCFIGQWESGNFGGLLKFIGPSGVLRLRGFYGELFSWDPIEKANRKIPDHPKNAPNLSPNPTTRHQQFQSNFMAHNFQNKFLKNPGLHPTSLSC